MQKHSLLDSTCFFAWFWLQSVLHTLLVYELSLFIFISKNGLISRTSLSSILTINRVCWEIIWRFFCVPSFAAIGHKKENNQSWQCDSYNSHNRNLFRRRDACIALVSLGVAESCQALSITITRVANDLVTSTDNIVSTIALWTACTFTTVRVTGTRLIAVEEMRTNVLGAASWVAFKIVVTGIYSYLLAMKALGRVNARVVRATVCGVDTIAVEHTKNALLHHCCNWIDNRWRCSCL